MCGLVAIISKKAYGFVYKDLEAFEELLYADALRGDDSTGVIGVDKFGDMYIDKAALDGRDFLLQYVKSQAHKEMLSYGVGMIGHNRKGTVGKVSDETAHPFVVNDNFALVHNGTLYNHTKLKDTTVDSEALAYHLEAALRNPNYSLDTFGEALAEVNGAYACIWYDQLRDKIQFMRNEQRPLWIADCEDMWALASEGSMLHWILGRNSMKYSKLEQIKTNTLYTLSPGTRDALVVEDIPTKKAMPTTTANTRGVGTSTGANLGNTDNLNSNTLSKQQFKRLRKFWLNRSVDFWVEDYVEKNLFQHQADEQDYLLMGSSPDLESYRHIVRGEVNLDKLGLTSPKKFDDFFFRGTIRMVEFDDKTREVIFHVNGIRLVPQSSPFHKDKSNEKTTVTIH